MEDSQITNKSPLNNSKSKAMYSFPKGNRFQDEQPINDTFYNTPSTIDKRATSIGFGKKMEINFGMQITPSPDRYMLPQYFGPKGAAKGVSFGAGRQIVKFVSIFTNNKNPGPGNYDSNPKYPTKQYSIRKKITFPDLFPDSNTPGPGKYELESINSQGSYISSKIKSNISYKIHKSPQKQNKLSTLGPGFYQVNLPANGKQILAKNRTQQASSFSKNIRNTLSLSLLAPGPGAYQTFSEFGK